MNDSIGSNTVEVRIVEKFEFTSDRRRMSVMIKWPEEFDIIPEGSYVLLTKGAD